MGPLAVFGAGGHGKVIADCAELLGWGTIHFFDDGVEANTQVGPWPVVGNLELLKVRRSDYDGIVVAVGSNAIRLRIVRELRSLDSPIVNLIHPSATVSPRAAIGAGTVVLASAVINVDARLGDGCIVNSGAVVEHDCYLDCGVHLSPGAVLGGGVTAGSCAWIGAGAVVKELVTIGKGSLVGAGSVVIRDVSDNLIVVGSPAREIPRK